MPDRSLRFLTFPRPSARGGERGAVLLREHPSSRPETPGGEGSGDGRRGSEENNPFAPPPEGTPDQPWRPRRSSGDEGDGSGGEGDGGARSRWGGRWSDRQPGRSTGGFGDRPRGPETQGGDGADSPQGPGPRWDPTDPAQRRARYALLSGMWAFFFALFGWPYVALLLGALSVHWAVGTLRAKPRTASDPDSPAPPEQKGRQQTTAAVSGLVTAVLALILVAVSFTAQMVYRDYYTCTNDALTQQSRESCDDLLPDEIRNLLGTAE